MRSEEFHSLIRLLTCMYEKWRVPLIDSPVDMYVWEVESSTLSLIRLLTCMYEKWRVPLIDSPVDMYVWEVESSTH